MYVAVSVATMTGSRVRDWSIANFMIGLINDRNEDCDLCEDGELPLTAVTDVVWFPFSSEVVEAVIRFLRASSLSRWYRDANTVVINAEKNGSSG